MIKTRVICHQYKYHKCNKYFNVTVFQYIFIEVDIFHVVEFVTRAISKLIIEYENLHKMLIVDTKNASCLHIFHVKNRGKLTKHVKVTNEVRKNVIAAGLIIF